MRVYPRLFLMFCWLCTIVFLGTKSFQLSELRCYLPKNNVGNQSELFFEDGGRDFESGIQLLAVWQWGFIQ